VATANAALVTARAQQRMHEQQQQILADRQLIAQGVSGACCFRKQKDNDCISNVSVMLYVNGHWSILQLGTVQPETAMFHQLSANY